MHIDMKHLKKCSKCYVSVRALPQRFQGSWSEWSQTFAFLCPAGENRLVLLHNLSKTLKIINSCPVLFPEEKDQKPDKGQMEMYQVILCLVSVLLVTSSMIVLWKNK